jgi:hypothetical protein
MHDRRDAKNQVIRVRETATYVVGRGRPESVWIENRGHVRRNGYNERVIRGTGRRPSYPTAASQIPACGIPAPGSSKERARRRVGVIILGC